MYQEIRYEVKAYKSDEGLSLQLIFKGNMTVASCFLRKGCLNNNTHLLAVFKEAVKAEIDTLFMETLK